MSGLTGGTDVTGGTDMSHRNVRERHDLDPADRQLLRFTKHHGAGNDFLVLIDPGSTGPLPGDLVQALCDRQFGVGADGVIQIVACGTSAPKWG